MLDHGREVTGGVEYPEWPSAGLLEGGSTQRNATQRNAMAGPEHEHEHDQGTICTRANLSLAGA